MKLRGSIDFTYRDWNRKVNIRNAKHFDLDGFHPNIVKDKSFGKKSAKSAKHDMIKYVTKDGDYIEFGIECKKCIRRPIILCKSDLDNFAFI